MYQKKGFLWPPDKLPCLSVISPSSRGGDSRITAERLFETFGLLNPFLCFADPRSQATGAFGIKTDKILVPKYQLLASGLLSTGGGA